MTDLTLDLTGAGPLYERLYRAIAEQIRSGALHAGEKLPGRRRLGEHLGLSLTTVERAYGLLTAEGYLEARPRSGYFVAQALALPTPPPPPASPMPPPKKPGLRECFSTAAVDTDLFPYAAWARLSREAVYENPDLLQRGDSQGDWGVRLALAEFLRQYRAVRCTPEQVVLAAGLEGAMGILLQLLPQAVFALEDPGYAAVRRLLDNLERPYVPVAVDDKGMNVEALTASGADLAYVTPSHQFPLGVTTPAGRRGELLRWAYAHPTRYIVEDDYDSEFRYDRRPIPAMQGSDHGDRVIYVGTFSRTIAPSIRAAYLILPPELLARYRQRLGHSACPVSRFEQETLRRFLSSGAYGRHLRRVGNLYRKRRDALLDALDGWGQVRGAQAGLHLLLTLPGREENDLVRRAAGAGFLVRGLGEYCLGASPLPGTLVLGFAGLPQEQARDAAAALRRALESGQSS